MYINDIECICVSIFREYCSPFFKQNLSFLRENAIKIPLDGKNNNIPQCQIKYSSYFNLFMLFFVFNP